MLAVAVAVHMLVLVALPVLVVEPQVQILVPTLAVQPLIEAVAVVEAPEKTLVRMANAHLLPVVLVLLF